MAKLIALDAFRNTKVATAGKAAPAQNARTSPPRRATITQMEAKALDRLTEAGRISNEDRDRVQFVVRILVGASEAA